MRITTALLGILATGCAISEEEFSEEYWNLSCDKMFECTSTEDIEAAGELWFFGDDATACKLDGAEETEEEEGEEHECIFDSDSASTCLTEYEALTCDDIAEGTTVDACSSVCG